MNIYLYNPFGGSLGHSQKYSTNIATGLKLARCNNNITLVTSSDFNKSDCQKNNINIIATHHSSYKRQKGVSLIKNLIYGAWILYSNVRLSAPLIKLSLNKEKKIIHMIGGEVLTNTIILILMPKRNCMKFITIHNSDFDINLYPNFFLKGLYKEVCKYVLRIATKKDIGFFTHGIKMKDTLLKQLCTEFDKCYTYKVPINIRDEPKPINKSCNLSPITRILFVGVIRLDKGLDLLIDALSQIKNSNWFLDICGSATQVGDSYVYALASKLGNKVNLNLKYLSDNEIDNAFERSDLVVLPYRKSFIAQSVVMTEAVLHDKPVIVGSTSENSVDVIKYQLGWIFDCESVSSLAATIDMALDLIQKNKFALPKRDAYLKTISKLGVAEQIYFGYDNAELLHNSKL